MNWLLIALLSSATLTVLPALLGIVLGAIAWLGDRMDKDWVDVLAPLLVGSFTFAGAFFLPTAILGVVYLWARVIA